MIVVGIDGSEASKDALSLALHEAALRATRVRVVHAWLPTLPVSMTGPGMIPPVDVASIESLSRHLLDDTVAHVAGDRAAAVDRVLVEGTAGDAILDNARDAELIVLGQHGRGAVKSLVLGSVSHHVLQHARCPVLVVPVPQD